MLLHLNSGKRVVWAVSENTFHRNPLLLWFFHKAPVTSPLVNCHLLGKSRAELTALTNL